MLEMLDLLGRLKPAQFAINATASLFNNVCAGRCPHRL